MTLRRLLGHFSEPMWLAVRGVAGSLPFHVEADPADKMMSSLAAEAARFRRNKA